MDNRKLVFIDAEEKYLAGVVLYGNGDDTVLTYDSTHKKQVPAEELKNLFLKGLAIIENEGKIYKPVTFEDKTTHYEVIVVGENLSSAEFKNFKSANIEGE